MTSLTLGPPTFTMGIICGLGISIFLCWFSLKIIEKTEKKKKEKEVIFAS